jgi:hypothetical protein
LKSSEIGKDVVVAATRQAMEYHKSFITEVLCIYTYASEIGKPSAEKECCGEVASPVSYAL